MKETEFLKEHPSTKDKIFKPMGIVYNRQEPLMTINNIHETQLDKEKVQRTFDNRIEVWGNIKKGKDQTYQLEIDSRIRMLEEMKIELRLNTSNTEQTKEEK